MPTLPYLVFRRRRGRVIWPRGGSGRGIPVSRSKTGWGLHSTPVTLPRRGAAAVCRVDHSRAIHPYSHRATPASGQFIMILRLGGHASRVIRSHALRQAPRSSVKKYRAPATINASLGAALARRFSDAPAYNDAPLAETVKMGAAASCVGSKEDPITTGDVEVAQEAWAKGIVDIGKVYQDKGD